MGINVVLQYSHLEEKCFILTYDALVVKFTETLEVCDGCTLSKEKWHSVRNKTYIRAKNPGKRVLVDTTGPFP